MSTLLEKTIRETLGDLDNLSPETIHQLIQEALQTFMSLNQKRQSPDPKERDEVFKTAMSLKEAIETQREELVKSAGIDPGAFAQLAENEALFNADIWSELKGAKQEFEALRHALIAPPKNSTFKKKKAPRIILQKT